MGKRAKRSGKASTEGQGSPVDDPLDKTISVAAELTATGVKASVRSRTVAAFDRLLGNVVDYVNIPVERRNVEERTKIDASHQLVKAMKLFRIGA